MYPPYEFGTAGSGYEFLFIIRCARRPERLETEASIRRCSQQVLGALDQLDVEAEALELANEHIERFGHARLDRRFTLHDRFVKFRAADHVVRLRREELLQAVRGTISFER